MIEYRVRPILGIRATWLTEIAHVREPDYFVDEQRAGPYRIWHHEHFFRELAPGKVEIRDLVHYALPLGWLGSLAHPWLVAPRLHEIFIYRQRVVPALFI